VVRFGADCGPLRRGRTMSEVNLSELLLSGNTGVDVAFFIPCPHCVGQGRIPMFLEGGPHGVDQNWLETCRHCYKEYGRATGKKLVKVPLADLVSYVVKNLGDDPVG
jgi:hypothetical protein